MCVVCSYFNGLNYIKKASLLQIKTKYVQKNGSATSKIAVFFQEENLPLTDPSPSSEGYPCAIVPIS